NRGSNGPWPGEEPGGRPWEACAGELASESARARPATVTRLAVTSHVERRVSSLATEFSSLVRPPDRAPKALSTDRVQYRLSPGSPPAGGAFRGLDSARLASAECKRYAGVVKCRHEPVLPAQRRRDRRPPVHQSVRRLRTASNPAIRTGEGRGSAGSVAR